MTPQLAAYIQIAATFSPVVVVGIWVWWELRDEAEETPEVESVIWYGRPRCHPSVGNFVEYTAYPNPVAMAEQILKEETA